jgi:hypothetical protein
VNPPTSINRKQLIELTCNAIRALQALMAEIDPPAPADDPEFYRPQFKTAPGQRSSELPPEPATNGYRCPKCGGQTVKRNGVRGRFMGCKAYPHCNGTIQPQANDDVRHEMRDRAIGNSIRGAMTLQNARSRP